jgi:hypothetical protein
MVHFKVLAWATERSEFQFQQGQEFSLLHVVHIGSGALLASYPVDTGGSFPRGAGGGGKVAGREADR